MSLKPTRVLALAAFAVAAAAGPLVVATDTPEITAQPGAQCLAWLGARGTGKCIGYENSSGPSWNIGNNGITTGPLLPGQSFNSSTGGSGWNP